MADDLFEQLQQINTRPAPFSHYTAAELWTEAHTSAQMLSFHLDGTVDLSSRKTAFIDRSAAWLVDRFGLDGGKRVVDTGCGPGLYTTRLAAAGARVTGIDFSERSIRYARQLAADQGLTIDYVHGDYLEHDMAQRFDLATMIMCDLCALSPAQRRALLDRLFGWLEPGGALLLDAYSLRGFDQREEQTTYAPNQLDGFWSAAPYFGFVNTFKYEAEKVVLDKYTIVEQARTQVIYNWLQYFSRAALSHELEDRGFVVDEILGDVAGGAFDPSSSELAVIAHKP